MKLRKKGNKPPAVGGRRNPEGKEREPGSHLRRKKGDMKAAIVGSHIDRSFAIRNGETFRNRKSHVEIKKGNKQ